MCAPIRGLRRRSAASASTATWRRPHHRGRRAIFWAFHDLRDYAPHAGGRQAPPCARPAAAPGASWTSWRRRRRRCRIVFGHHDLLPANFLDDGTRLWLIDWEYARLRTALFDLAGARLEQCACRRSRRAHACSRPISAAPADASIWRAFDAMKAPRCCARRCGAWSPNSISTRPASTTPPIPPRTSARLRAAYAAYRSNYGTIHDMTLPTHAQIVVIGGGIIGCSTAYHLARDHKADVLLLEQGKLTSGSTWHAAGLVGQLRSSASITQVLKYSVDLYKRLDAETGLDTGWKMTGCLRLATNADRWTEYQAPGHHRPQLRPGDALLSPDEVKTHVAADGRRDLVGATWLPTDGQASPSDITQSLAKGARMHGVRIVEACAVTGFEMDDGRITPCRDRPGRDRLREGRELRRPMGAADRRAWPASTCRCSRSSTSISSPRRSTACPPTPPTLRDPDRRTYFKEEVGGLVMGGYEPNPQPWATGDIPDDWRVPPLRRRLRPFRASTWSRPSPACPALETRRRQADDQRPGELHARTAIHPRRGAGMRQHVCRRRLQRLRHRLGRRRGLGAGRMGGDGRGAARPLGRSTSAASPTCTATATGSRDRTLEAYGKHYTIAFPHEEYTVGPPAHRLAAL